MKKANNHSGKRPLKKVFIRNYAVISALMIVAIVVALFGTDLFMSRFIYKLDVTQIHGSDIYRYPFDNISRHLLDKYGGWFEIVNESGEIIYVKGNKEDDIVRYEDGQMYAKMDVERNDDSISYHAYHVEGPHRESYVLLWKIPERYLKLSTVTSIFAALFAVFLFIALYFYARYSVKQVKKPLEQIVEGIKEMERFNYTKRLHYSAEQEFAEIQEAFNDMAERLQHTSAEKEMAENNKRNMLLHLSHDLKTPITSIYGYSQLLLDNQTLTDKDTRKYIQYIYDKSSYMSNLIKDLFELAKLDDKHTALNREKENITKWFQQLVVEFYPEIEEKGFELEAHIPEEPLFAKMDKIHMSRVITNLISNALRYNPAGTVLYVSCEREEENVILWIGDNGIGVQEPIREHVFEEFIRGDGPIKDSTGLGLAICKKIITLHEGTIELEQDQRYSTLFRISLPITI
ncbi:HAMP domain-containing sensor histidine kinase [Paenibacillus sp. DMB20]|uniref:HAMP domain-containing sensor histidine kinase n=1 Tax=Paenibacillus sp. DMB20 TaxID=1642570 RepID=UPI00062757A4|nr:HAMP domain-containing sensor histidine kinase [Paenibacillus sp. DMB20]KKO53107.1 histidine kinase [Paenibacillus sp. DMB20]